VLYVLERIHWDPVVLINSTSPTSKEEKRQNVSTHKRAFQDKINIAKKKIEPRSSCALYFNERRDKALWKDAFINLFCSENMSESLESFSNLFQIQLK